MIKPIPIDLYNRIQELAKDVEFTLNKELKDVLDLVKDIYSKERLVSELKKLYRNLMLKKSKGE